MRKLATHVLERAGFSLSRTVDSYADMARLLAAHDVRAVVDGGAAKGTETARLAELFPHATIYAFEPHPAAFARLQTRFEHAPRVTLFPVAIADAPGTADLHISAKPTQTSLLRASDPKMVTVASARVEVTTVERLIAAGRMQAPQVVKLDLQGSELRALKGIGPAIRDVLAVLVEVSFRSRYADGCLYHDVAAEMYKHGLRLFRLSDLHAHHSGAWTRADALFLRADILETLFRSDVGMTAAGTQQGARSGS